MTGAALDIAGLCWSLEEASVIRNVDLCLPPGARHALIGPNGAGKTTLLKLITGWFRPTSGTVRLDGEDVTGLGQAARLRFGVTRSFRLSRQARRLTVLDNLRLAAARRQGTEPCVLDGEGAGCRFFDQAMTHLEALGLAQYADLSVDDLRAGGQRRVEIAIALAQRPRLLLLDEPTDGVPPEEVPLILDLISKAGQDVTLLIVDHKLDVVFQVADRVSVLVAGVVQLEGTREDIIARRHHAEQLFTQLSPGALRTVDRIVARITPGADIVSGTARRV